MLVFIERFLFLVNIVRKHHPRLLPVDQPASNILTKEKRPKRILLDFDGIFSASALLRFVPRANLKQLPTILHLVKDEKGIRTRLIARKAAARTSGHLSQALTLAAPNSIKYCPFVGGDQPPPICSQALSWKPKDFDRLTPRHLPIHRLFP